MLIYICFSCSEQDQLVNALFGCQRQSTLSWEPDCWVVCRICLLKVSGHFFPSLWRVCECVNSAFWSLSVIERLLARRTAEGLKRDQSPLSGPSGTFGFSFFFFFLHVAESELLSGGNDEERRRGKFSEHTRDTLAYEAGWWFSDHINLTLEGIFISALVCLCSCVVGAACVGFAPAINLIIWSSAVPRTILSWVNLCGSL